MICLRNACGYTLVVLFFVLLLPVAILAVPGGISYQGQLTDITSEPVEDGTVPMIFALHTGPLRQQSRDDVHSLTVSSLDSGGTVASEDGGYHLWGSLGLPVQGNIFSGDDLMIRAGFWFGKGQLTPERPKSRLLFMILPVLAGSHGS